jgi:hypothetical protein
LSFSSKAKGVSLRFYRQTYIRDKNWLKIHISSLWDLYFCLARNYGDIQFFLRFWKLSSFGSKPKGANLRFYRQTYVHGENGSKIYIWTSWGTYSISFRHFGVVHKSLEVLKDIWVLAQNPKRLAFVLPTNVYSCWNGSKIIFYLSEAHILAWLDITVLYTVFLGLKKFWVWAHDPKGLAFGFIKKYLFTVKICQKSVFHPSEIHIIA